MNQVSIGKFISERRKYKKLTQEQLAEKLGISDRAVSKWERGINLPDASLMLNLCSILDITVNELLTGEIIKKEDYMNKAEEKLVEMKQSEEKIVRKLYILQTILTTLCVVFSIITIAILFIHMFLNYVYEDYNGILFEAFGPLCIILTFIFTFTVFVLHFREKYEIKEKNIK